MTVSNKRPMLSLCIPTNGIIEWVVPVLESIFSQNVDESLFEVIITDNGNNTEFFELMTKYKKEHPNFKYVKTVAPLFLNEIEAYKMANGVFIKFLNHRTKLLPNALLKLVNFVESNLNEKPIVYFSNGALRKEKKVYNYMSFEEFVLNLSYWSSWSTGMGFWKDDFDKIPSDEKYNELFPHTTILFFVKERSKFIIDNNIFLDEIPTGKKPKGNYDLFYAFAIEYPSIMNDLLRNNFIRLETFLDIKSEILDFVTILYYDFIVKKKYCSYDLTSFDNSINVFYSKKVVKYNLIKMATKKIISKKVK